MSDERLTFYTTTSVSTVFLSSKLPFPNPLYVSFLTKHRQGNTCEQLASYTAEGTLTLCELNKIAFNKQRIKKTQCNKTQMRQESRLGGAKDEILTDTNCVLTSPTVALRTFLLRCLFSYIQPRVHTEKDAHIIQCRQCCVLVAAKRHKHTATFSLLSVPSGSLQ